MEDIRIPKLSVMMENRIIFTDMRKFCAVTGYKPESTLTQNIQAVKKHKQSVFSMNKVFRTLRNSVLNKTRQGYNIIREEEHRDTFLSRDMQSELREKKNLLLNIIHKHGAAMANLREARIKCWKTQAKLAKYSLILATQKSALLFNEHEKEMRVDALKEMEHVFDKWMLEHNKDHIHFEKTLLNEIRLREKLEKISRDIEADICNKIYEAIAQLMDKNDQTLGSEELIKLTNKLYKQACRVYTFQIIENSPCNKQWIEKPTFKKCEWNDTDIDAKMVNTKLHETSGQHDVEIMGKLFQSVS